jgi:hypothetical protein
VQLAINFVNPLSAVFVYMNSACRFVCTVAEGNTRRHSLSWWPTRAKRVREKAFELATMITIIWMPGDKLLFALVSFAPTDESRAQNGSRLIER